MKRILLILILLPWSLTAQTEFYLSVLTVDINGQAIPNCDFRLIVPEDTMTLKFQTNKNGTMTTRVKVKNGGLLIGQHEDYYNAKTKLRVPSTIEQNDTIFSTLTFEPMRAIQHGFTNIDLDSTYALGELADLRDSITILTQYDQIKYWQNYTKLDKMKKGTYRLHYWTMENGGLVEPTLYRDHLKVKWKGNDKLQFKFDNKTKIYFIKGIKTNAGFHYELVKK